jgi:hypothetical protein
MYGGVLVDFTVTKNDDLLSFVLSEGSFKISVIFAGVVLAYFVLMLIPHSVVSPPVSVTSPQIIFPEELFDVAATATASLSLLDGMMLWHFTGSSKSKIRKLIGLI